MAESNGKGRFSPFTRQLFVTVAIFFNTMGHGAGVGYVAVLSMQLQVPGALIQITPSVLSWIASMVGPSLVIGNFLSGPIMSRFGRKKAMYCVILPAMIGWFITILATTREELFVGKILQGISFGMVLPLRSCMLGEYLTPANRGPFMSTISLGQAAGITTAHIIGSFISWQMTGLVISFFFFISLIITIYSPESPSYLASKGRYDEAREAFRWLRGDGEEQELNNLIKLCLLAEKNKIELEILRRRGVMIRVAEAIKKPEFFKPIILMTHAFFLGQFSGAMALANYPTKVIGGLIGPEASVPFWMIFLDVQRLCSNMATIFIIGKVKRRTMMLSTGLLCVLSHVGIAGYMYLKKNGLLFYDAAWIPMLLLNLQIMSVGMGMVPMPNVLAGEVYPLEYRSICGSFSLVTSSFILFTSLKTFPSFLEAVGLHGTYVIYTLILAYSLSVVMYLLPETKGRTLQEIEDIFRGQPLLPEEMEVRKSLQKIHESRLSLRKSSIHSIDI
ncbi:facilitated trehalose transporter Tret1 [Plutella xylostella]|uniref:facilitated trehalose transporter Tret1 n=1 Tax=Plutella xylostella TaxID=51655 RepID=UPI00203299A3|nr:facilitated trehalose transporter Tret1 [Plutella xylostella]